MPYCSVGLLTLRLFGAIEATVDCAPVLGLQARSGDRLLAYLALNHRGPVSRGGLAHALWPATAVVEGNSAKALQSLRQSLTALRGALGPELAARLHTDGATVYLDLEAADTDIVPFDRALAGHDDPGPLADLLRRDAGRLAAVQRAVALYRGPLLAEWPEPWAAHAREARRRCYLAAAEALAHLAGEAGDHHAAARYLRRLVLGRPSYEAGWAALMEELAAAGERVEALDVYSRYVEYLARHGSGAAQPPPRLAALAAGLRSTVGTAAWPSTEAGQRPGTGNTDGDTLEPAGGAVPVTSRYYVERQADADLRSALARRDSTVLIKGPRQVGKTSLLAHGLHAARQGGATVLLTDLQKLANDEMGSLETLYRGLAGVLGTQVGAGASDICRWDPGLSPSASFERFVRHSVLGPLEGAVVWGIDEVDRLFARPYRSDVFGLFRSWHNERALDPAGPWSRLTLVLAYATEAHLFISDLNQSPFNVGTRLSLGDFTVDEVADLNRRHGSPLADARQVDRLYALVGGHPYLVRRALYEMAARGLTIDAVEATEGGGRDHAVLFADHLERMLHALEQDAALVEATCQVLRGGPCPNWESFHRLTASGVLVGTSLANVQPRCRLYASFLSQHLLPDA